MVVWEDKAPKSCIPASPSSVSIFRPQYHLIVTWKIYFPWAILCLSVEHNAQRHPVNFVNILAAVSNPVLLWVKDFKENFTLTKVMLMVSSPSNHQAGNEQQLIISYTERNLTISDGLWMNVRHPLTVPLGFRCFSLPRPAPLRILQYVHSTFTPQVNQHTKNFPSTDSDSVEGKFRWLLQLKDYIWVEL